MGAVSVSHANEGVLGSKFINNIISGDSLGDAFISSANDAKKMISEISMNYMLFGDPTFVYGGTKNSAPKTVDLAEAEKDKWIAFSSKTPVDNFKTCYEGETTDMDFNEYKNIVLAMNKQYAFSGISETGGKVVIQHNRIIILPDLDGNGKVQCGEKNVVNAIKYTTKYDDWISKCHSIEGSPVNLNNYLKAVVLFMNKGSSAFYGKSDLKTYLLNGGSYYPKIYDKKTLYLPDLNADGLVKCYIEDVPKGGGPSKGTSETGGDDVTDTEGERKPAESDEKAVSELGKNYDEYKKSMASDADPIPKYYEKATEFVMKLGILVTQDQVQNFINNYGGEQTDHLGPYISALINNNILQGNDVELDLKKWSSKYLTMIGHSIEAGKTLTVNGDVGLVAGYMLRGGTITINGETGNEIGRQSVSGIIQIKPQNPSNEVTKQIKEKLIRSLSPNTYVYVYECTTGSWIGNIFRNIISGQSYLGATPTGASCGYKQIWPEKTIKKRLDSYYSKNQKGVCSYLNNNNNYDQCYQMISGLLQGMPITNEDIQEFVDDHQNDNLIMMSSTSYFMVFVSALIDSSVDQSISLKISRRGTDIRPAEYPPGQPYYVAFPYVASYIQSGKYIKIDGR